MKCLTLSSPFAEAVAYGLKDVENRDRRFRGEHRLLIHVGLARRLRAAAQRVQSMVASIESFIGLHPGHIIGVCYLRPGVRVHEIDSPWASGPWCHPVTHARVFPKPIPWRGMPGMFDVPDELVAEQLEQALEPAVAIQQLRPKPDTDVEASYYERFGTALE